MFSLLPNLLAWKEELRVGLQGKLPCIIIGAYQQYLYRNRWIHRTIYQVHCSPGFNFSDLCSGILVRCSVVLSTLRFVILPFLFLVVFYVATLML